MNNKNAKIKQVLFIYGINEKSLMKFCGAYENEKMVGMEVLLKIRVLVMM